MSGSYRLRGGEPKHVDEVLKLLSVVTGDGRFEEGVNEERKEKGGVTICPG